MPGWQLGMKLGWLARGAQLLQRPPPPLLRFSDRNRRYETVMARGREMSCRLGESILASAGLIVFRFPLHVSDELRNQRLQSRTNGERGFIVGECQINTTTLLLANMKQTESESRRCICIQTLMALLHP